MLRLTASAAVDLDQLLPAVIAAIHATNLAYVRMRGVGFGRHLYRPSLVFRELWREGSVGCRSEIGDNCGKQAGVKGENRVQCSAGNNGDAGGDQTVLEGRGPGLLAMKRLTLADRGLGAI